MAPRSERSRPVRLPRLLWGVAQRRRGYRSVPAFRDPVVQRDLADAGYHVTEPIVPTTVVEDLLEACAEWRAMAPPADDGRFHFSGAQPPTPATEHARAAIRDLLVPRVAELVDPDVISVGPSVFQVKPSSPHSGIRSHQDPFLVDERRSFTVSAWTALTDVDEECGPMIVLPGSHRFARWNRVATTTDDFDGYHHVIERHARMVTMRPGQVLLFDSALIHGSLVNRSGRTRFGASCVLIPRHEPITAPEASPAGPPQTARLFHLGTDRATGRTSPDRRDAEVVGRIRLDRLRTGPAGLDLVCRAQARVGRDAGGAPVPAGISTA